MRESNVNIENEIHTKEQAALFIKVGIVVLSCLVIIGFGITYFPKVVVTSNLSHKRDLPIYSVETEEKKVALTFDAAWGNEQTQTILDILEANDVKATFFLTGVWIEKYPESVKAIIAAGHDIGSHSENHKHMSKLNKQQCIDELKKPHEKVKMLTGYEMNLFRAPYGDYNNILLNAARESGYYTIQWDVDSLDWKDYGTQSIINEVCNNKHLGNGSIILCHNGAKYILDALDTMIKTLKSKGYEFVKLSDLIYKEDYYMDHEGRQFQQ